MRKTPLIAAIAVGAALLGSSAARADAIDGDWCSSVDMRHLSIEGPKIVTPNGVAMNGDYDRHYFQYLAPDGEREAGKQIAMRLVNENTMLFLAEGQTEPEVWTRCTRPAV